MLDGEQKVSAYHTSDFAPHGNLRPHYHTITKTEPVNVPVPVPVPAPPAQVITHVKNVPIHDPWTKEDENPPFLRPYSKYLKVTIILDLILVLLKKQYIR